MKTSSFTTIIFSLLVFLNGIMTFQALSHTLALLIEVPLSIVLFVAALRMIPHKKYAHHLAALCSLPLMIYYGILFSADQEYFAGVLAALSAIVLFINIIQVFHLGETE